MLRPPARRRRAYTLIELLVAMAVLSIMMLMMFQYLISTQRTWSLSESTTRIYDNSRVAFDVIERDLLTSLFSQQAGQEVGFYVGTPNPADANQALQCVLVSSREPVDDATSRLVEVGYSHHVSPAEPSTQYILWRRLVSDQDTANWNFISRPANWFLNDNTPVVSNWEKVIGGVAEFNIYFYDSTDQVFLPGTDTDRAPSRAVINMVLFDEALTYAPAAVRDKTQRDFTKVLFLDRIIQR